MGLQIKHVADLLTKNFNIPKYQRGYRWEKKHVTALLDDILLFATQSDQDKSVGKFYCIQPLAVVKNKTLSVENKNECVYDVIDGQQRLTTLYLILTYLQEARNAIYGEKLAKALFSLKYESRDSSFFDEKKFQSLESEEYLNNIDFFYMARAYKNIDDWFNMNEHQSDKGTILKKLIPDGYRIITDEMDEEEKKEAERINDGKNDVRFLWYEVENNTNIESIEVFNQLNYGKTALTSTELVKALILQCDLYKDRAVQQEIAFRRSCEWDAMEKQLQDPFMWSMLMKEEEEKTSHMALILKIVSIDIYQDLKKKDKELTLNLDDKDFEYQVNMRFLGNNSDGKYAERVGILWQKIQDVYTSFYNWYSNREVFHLIGLLVWLKEQNSSFDYTKKVTWIISIINEYNKMLAPKFLEYLRREIGNIIKVDEFKKTSEGKEEPWGLSRINYNDNPKELIKILVMFNVEELLSQQDEKAYFAFHLLRKQKITSLEHIHPQNMDMDGIEVIDLSKWLDAKEAALIELNRHEEFKERIFTLKSYLKDKTTYLSNKDSAIKIIKEIDLLFDDLAGMKEEQMHTLYNMALVDKDTNSALSNNLLDLKRDILKSRSAKGVYILPSTRRVFSKYYTKHSNSNPMEKLWTQPDREAYFHEIENKYQSYINF